MPSLGRLKRDGQAIAMVTAYDATFARLVDEAGVDIILVGDSMGMVMQGHPHTLEVTLEHMIYHARCVRRAVQRAHLVVDMPFMSYQASIDEAMRHHRRIIGAIAARDPDLAALWAEIADRRADNMRHFVTDVIDGGSTLPDGLTIDEAADLIWATNGTELYLLLVEDRGWPIERYVKHLGQIWTRLLLP